MKLSYSLVRPNWCCPIVLSWGPQRNIHALHPVFVNLHEARVCTRSFESDSSDDEDSEISLHFASGKFFCSVCSYHPSSTSVTSVDAIYRGVSAPLVTTIRGLLRARTRALFLFIHSQKCVLFAFFFFSDFVQLGRTWLHLPTPPKNALCARLVSRSLPH